jgi:hypothetical protein
MADIAAFRASLVRLGFSVPASAHITTDAGQDLSFEDLVDLVEDDITVLCNSVRRPGGTIPNPNAGAAPNIPVMIPNPGIPVSALAERRMKITTYLARLYAHRIYCTLTPANITIATIRNAQVIMERDAVQKNPTDCHKIPDTKSMMEFLEDPDSFLTAYVGEDKVPYPYLYRQEINPPEEVNDPRTNYQSVELEMIARAPHDTETYTVDNAAFAKLLKDMVVGFKDAITWARDSFRDRDGRAVMRDWMLHFCGAARQETVEIAAEATMDTTFYKGEKPHFMFVIYTNIHRGCHNNINAVRCLAQPRLTEMDKNLKVRKYLTGIQAPELAAAVAAVKATPNIKSSFDLTADFLTGFVKQNTPTMRISSVTNHGGRGRGGGGGRGRGGREQRSGRCRSGGRGGHSSGRGGRGGRSSRGRGGGRSSDSVTERYYMPDEYAELTGEQRHEVH